MRECIVIDTNIWVNALYGNNLQCAIALDGFMLASNLKLAMDSDQNILKEYEPYISSQSAVLPVVGRKYQHFYGRLMKCRRVVYVVASISSEDAEQLRNYGFHEPEDMVFVATAMAADRVIVTEDSDYGVSESKSDEGKRLVAEYMREKMGLVVISACTFTEEFGLSELLK